MQTFICDACGKVTDSPITIEWERPDTDEEGDAIVWDEELHACSWQCAAAACMDKHLNQGTE